MTSSIQSKLGLPLNFTDTLDTETHCIYLKAPGGFDRVCEPVSIGVPFADGQQIESSAMLVGDAGQVYPCQCEVLSSWPSGNPRWVLVTTYANLAANSECRLRLARLQPNDSLGDVAVPLQLKCEQHKLFSLRPTVSTEVPSLTAQLEVIRSGGSPLTTSCHHSPEPCNGAVTERLSLEGRLGSHNPIHYSLVATHFKNNSLLKIDVTLHNPRRAEHVGGYWDLGDPQSELIDSASLVLETDMGIRGDIRWSENGGESWSESTTNHLSISQNGSGGDQWEGRVHLDSRGNKTVSESGYRVTDGQQVSRGKRAIPIVQLLGQSGTLTATVVDFWQKFPTAIEVNGSKLTVHLFPKQQNGPFELQGGEKMTRTVWVGLKGSESPGSDLRWVHSPITATPMANHLSSTNCLDFFSSERKTRESENSKSPLAVVESDVNELHTHCTKDEEGYLEELMSGARNLFWKREQIDEYGWRNFGDFWADHEELYSDDPSPVISHYNNQYDLLHGLLRQYLRTRDQRWWDLARPLAEHIVDIDIYNTKHDRAVFNGGLFWHTSHYRDAATCTHRSYSKEMVGEKHPVHGGGLGNEHNYTSGLLLFYHLTGSPRAKDAVVSLADWVIGMDDGRQSVLAPLSSAPTGKASSTSVNTYHGPGRGVGNSINALVDAWQLTRSLHYLDKCRELIQRVIHPEEDITSLDLMNAEMRWSYTVGLQALARYEHTVGSADAATASYVRASLIRYGRWMQENEKLYLEDSSQLEFPTETWPAQDMRKGTTMMLLSAYLEPAERKAMYSTGINLYDKAKKQLFNFQTRCCTRPAAIALQQFPIAWFAKNLLNDPAASIACELHSDTLQWPDRPVFQAQKENIRSNMRSPLGICKIALNAIRPKPWRYTIPETPLGRWMRRRTRR